MKNKFISIMAAVVELETMIMVRTRGCDGGGYIGGQSSGSNGYGVSGRGGTQSTGGAGGTGKFTAGNAGTFGMGGNGWNDCGYSYGGGGGGGIYGGGSGMCGSAEGQSSGGRRCWIYKYIEINKCIYVWI